MTAITSAISRAAISCMLLLTLSHVAAADDDKAKLDNLKRAISSLEKQLGQRDKEKNTLATELKKVEVDAANISKNIRRVTQQINGHVATLQNLDVQQHDLRKNIKQQNAAISEHIAASYKLGNQESIKLLLNQEDPQKLARVFKYYSYFIDTRNEKIAAYTADVEKLAVLSTEVSQQKEQLDSAKEQLLDNQQKLLAASKTRAATLQKLTLSLQNDRGKLDKLLKERRELEELLATVERASRNMQMLTPAGKQSFASRKGSLRWPINGKVAHSYGSQRSGTMRWEGLFITAKMGEPVAAVHDGQVIFSNYMRGFGLLIILNHGDGFMTLYAHNQELIKDTGDWVLSNETIARAGDTGGMDQAAVYFEIRQKGQPTDPKAWLGKR